MDSLLVFGSEECMSWDPTVEVIEQLRNDEDFEASIKVLDPVEHEETFRDYGLVICPSTVYRGEVISVGPPSIENVKEKVRELKYG